MNEEKISMLERYGIDLTLEECLTRGIKRMKKGLIKL